MDAVILRPLRDTRDDADCVHEVMTAAFDAGPVPTRDAPEPRPGAEGVRERAFIRHLARTDPGGCWLATDDAGIPVGAVLSIVKLPVAVDGPLAQSSTALTL